MREPPNVKGVDFLEAGIGPLVVLVHSSVSGARQWRRLMADLAAQFHTRAVNLFGYGGTPPWTEARAQSLDDQAALVEQIIPPSAGNIAIVGHSFGALVAMKAAMRLGDRVSRLVLLEPNPFYLLRMNGKAEAFAEADAMRRWIKQCGSRGDWSAAAVRFADYWGGAGSWDAMAAERRETFVEAIKPNFHEWDAAMGETTTLAQWAAALPRKTLVATAQETVTPIREIAALMRRHCPDWSFASIAAGGHMAPLTRPDLVNPMVRAFLQSS